MKMTLLEQKCEPFISCLEHLAKTSCHLWSQQCTLRSDSSPARVKFRLHFLFGNVSKWAVTVPHGTRRGRSGGGLHCEPTWLPGAFTAGHREPERCKAIVICAPLPQKGAITTLNISLHVLQRGIDYRAEGSVAEASGPELYFELVANFLRRCGQDGVSFIPHSGRTLLSEIQIEVRTPGWAGSRAWLKIQVQCKVLTRRWPSAKGCLVQNEYFY